MSWASQSFPWGDPGFPILRDTGESKIPPKTGLNTSHPVVLALEISGCSITDPHRPTISQRCLPSVFQSVIPPSRLYNLYLHCISIGEIQKFRTLTSSFRRQMKRPFLPRGGVVCSSLEVWHYDYHGIKLKD